MADREGSPTLDRKSNNLHKLAKKIARHFPTVPLISSSQVKLTLDDPSLKETLVLVDVRQPEEVAVSMIPGSITATELEACEADLAGKTIVCYCTVGYRSSSHASKLRQQGLDARNLEGGIVRWAQKNYPIVERSHGGPAAGQETKRIHVYGKDFALQPDDYEAVMFKSPFVATLRSVLPGWLGGSKA